MSFRVVVLGGYGHFGAVISRALASDPRIGVVVAGRDGSKALSFARSIGAEAAVLDANEAALADRLRGVDLVVSAAGPFQRQDYRVARAAIAAGAHYADIADGRDFVCGISALDGLARERDVLVVSGASSVPALSSAVLDRLASRLAVIDRIDIGITSSAIVPGPATLAGVLAYCGRPIQAWQEGAWRPVHGWQGLGRHRFRDPPMSRWLAWCDVPDLALFPQRYRVTSSVRFRAGVEAAAVQWGLWSLAWLARAGVVEPSRHAERLGRAARRVQGAGSGRSAMFVRVAGLDGEGRPRDLLWELRAEADHGANVPAMAAVALARQLAAGKISARGAMPCVGLVSLDAFVDELKPWRIETREYDT